MKYAYRLVIYFVVVVLVCIGILFFFRLFSHREIDDVHPDIACGQEWIDKSDILWVIPLYNNHSIADNPAWCSSILDTGKEIGMHGVYHSDNEFNNTIDSEYLQQGIIVFEKCFGRKPDMFKAPQLDLSAENKNLVEENGMKVYGQANQLFHKVYHCSDRGMFPNWMIRLF